MTLWLLRHAKTEEDSPDGSDQTRRLTLEGHNHIKELAKWLQNENLKPERILSSSATRALDTANGVHTYLKNCKNPEIRTSLYNANPDMVLSILAGSKETKIMVVGHNPCMEDLFSFLSNTRLHLKPGVCARFEYNDLGWESLFGAPKPKNIKIFDPRNPQ